MEIIQLILVGLLLLATTSINADSDTCGASKTTRQNETAEFDVQSDKYFLWYRPKYNNTDIDISILVWNHDNKKRNSYEEPLTQIELDPIALQFKRISFNNTGETLNVRTGNDGNAGRRRGGRNNCQTDNNNCHIIGKKNLQSVIVKSNKPVTWVNCPKADLSPIAIPCSHPSTPATNKPIIPTTKLPNQPNTIPIPLSPKNSTTIKDAKQRKDNQDPTTTTTTTTTTLIIAGSATVLVVVALVGGLVYYRKRALKAGASAERSSSSHNAPSPFPAPTPPIAYGNQCYETQEPTYEEWNPHYNTLPRPMSRHDSINSIYVPLD